MINHFSDRLITEIKEALDVDSQVILFQNRRDILPLFLAILVVIRPNVQIVMSV